MQNKACHSEWNIYLCMELLYVNYMTILQFTCPLQVRFIKVSLTATSLMTVDSSKCAIVLSADWSGDFIPQKPMISKSTDPFYDNIYHLMGIDLVMNLYLK